jgi:hypothetical protein
MRMHPGAKLVLYKIRLHGRVPPPPPPGGAARKVVFHYKSQVLLRYTYVNIIYYFLKKTSNALIHRCLKAARAKGVFSITIGVFAKGQSFVVNHTLMPWSFFRQPGSTLAKRAPVMIWGSR